MNNLQTKINDSQTEYYEELKKRKQYVAVYLTNGVQLKGYIEDYEEDIFFLKDGNSLVMVYKHAVSTVSPKSDK